ncbi:succinyl-diaminopimelate desuccinylase [Coxiella burnetii]|uniref:Succinyl-diaminopimelate desuccinylase n=6 Tax=Coxiella burnetii TaxID=777 RepID=DAPE_COXBU|nr:succinyl-diaminopimelate desuccinylase [Coxiella burnetii]NP_819696.1 succinyl-diaminopimelate desuccinylase [Coxiella burnetii RSA 493]A9KC82.1 RecName: Full=Succinyl-diaminopimelate desuccinylase; Short=SDAP desuccinylase; AltName: Full=N-succinyl-LL-2,6-diaminoheptanedioate amidohydrolase [Coxiella burnetii Dugway 5J108-111]B6J120.1 RecName: Full=Succinyl-diaminopimelate desuccinylase; Short=SDAP desuccinylase; AltName: Full=N-succinyl-LL-2,6-diaminoheptanedioate amidohydrolase [Coxiella b
MSETLNLLKQLIERPSITPNDAGCQTILIDRLKSVGFQCEHLPFGEVHNFWAWHGHQSPFIIFAGHTDVVPPGDETQWHSPPFTPTEKNGYIYGRGAADMKSGLAAMVVAAENFVKQNPDHNGTIGFIVTSDEEGPAENGTQKVVDYLQQKNIKLDYCIVGEASSNEKLGDAIKIGRRGSMHGELTIIGKQGHIAYPHLADNPIHRSFQAFEALAKTKWDEGNEHFTPTSFQFYNVEAGAGAANVIPATLKAKFNFRFAPIHTTQQLQQKVERILNYYQLNYDIQWNVSSQPFFSGNGRLATFVRQAIQEICHLNTEPNTYGGTSDGRFIATTGCEVIELGPVNKTAHHVNENICIADLEKLTDIYFRTLQLLT